MNNRQFKKLLNATGRRIISGTDYIKNNAKIKTEARKKRMLVDLWNGTLTQTINTIEDTEKRALVKQYYGVISEMIFKEISLELCYKLMNLWAEELKEGEIKQ